MKRLVVFGAIAALLAPDIALAQGGPPGGRPPSHEGGRPDRPGGNGGPGRPNPGAGKPDRPVPLPKPTPGRPNPGPGMRPPQHRPPAPRPPQRPPQFSWKGHSYNRYRGPAFRYPPGYAYRRWTSGALLPALFLSSLYFFDDWRAMGVTAPPPGYRWVRYGPDLLLVNVRTHRVRDVIYGAFY